jgi:hypothetical protein
VTLSLLTTKCLRFADDPNDKKKKKKKKTSLHDPMNRMRMKRLRTVQAKLAIMSDSYVCALTIYWPF